MTKEEHLEKIVAKCESLLATAAKRTPGEWKYLEQETVGRYPDNPTAVIHYGIEIGAAFMPIFGQMFPCSAEWDKSKSHEANTTFIASCAGSAEAGWRATIAAIKSVTPDDPIYRDTYYLVNKELINEIIAAWPEELL